MSPDAVTSRRSRAVLLAFVLVALVPVVGAAVRLHHAGWMPEGDDAMIARRTMAVFSDHPPITGQPSTAGALFTHDGERSASAGIEASHPGPLEYYLLAVPYRLWGWSPTGLLVAVALINGAAATAAVWLAWRRLGAVGAGAAALGVLVVAAHLGSWNLARPLNAGIAVLPLFAGLVAVWATIDGDRVAVLPGVVALSLTAQAHLGAAPLAGAALLALLAAWVVGLVRHVRSARTAQAQDVDHVDRSLADLPSGVSAIEDAPGPEPRTPGARWWAVGAGVVVLVLLCWGVVLGQQVVGDPGNLGRLADVARLKVDRAGLGFGVSVVADQVVQPAWPGVPPIPRISIIGPIALGSALAKLALLAVTVGACTWWASRRTLRSEPVSTAPVTESRDPAGNDVGGQNRDIGQNGTTGRRAPELVRLAAVVGGAALVAIAVLSRGPDEVRLGPSYQVTSLLAVSGLVVLLVSATLATVARDAIRRRWPDLDGRRAALAAAGSLGLVALAVAWLGGPTYREDAARTRAVVDAIERQVPKGTYKLQADGTWAYLSTLDAASVELIRDGYDIRVVRLGGIPDEPVRRNTDVDAPTIMLDSTGRPRTDGKLLVERGTAANTSWATGLLDAVGSPRVEVDLAEPSSWKQPDAPACFERLGRLAERDRERDGAPLRRNVALAVLACSQTDRRAAATRIEWQGLDQFWVDLLGSNMPAPYPHTGLAAYLIPAT